MPIDDVPSLTGRTRARDHDSVMGSLRFSDDIQADSTFAHERGNHRHDLQPRFRQAVSGTYPTPCRKQSTGTTAARAADPWTTPDGLPPMDYPRWYTVQQSAVPFADPRNRQGNPHQVPLSCRISQTRVCRVTHRRVLVVV